MYYAQIELKTRVCGAVTETHGAIDVPDMIEIPELDFSLLGKRHNEETGEFEVVDLPIAPQHATKRAFQSRFPKMPNGISTKWDAMCMFLSDDGYAASLGVTGAALFELRMLITTGVQRMNASPYVDMAPTAEAAGLTALLMQGAIPGAFRLSAAERGVMLNTPLADHELYKG